MNSAISEKGSQSADERDNAVLIPDHNSVVKLYSLLQYIHYVPGQIPSYVNGPYSGENDLHCPLSQIRAVYEEQRDQELIARQNEITLTIDAYEHHSRHGAAEMIVTPYAVIEPVEVLKLFTEGGFISDWAEKEKLIQRILHSERVMIAGSLPGSSAINFIREFRVLANKSCPVDVYDISGGALDSVQALVDVELKKGGMFKNVYLLEQDLTVVAPFHEAYDVMVADAIDVYMRQNNVLLPTLSGMIQEALKPGGYAFIRGLEQKNVNLEELHVNNRVPSEALYGPSEDDLRFHRWLQHIGIDIPIEIIMKSRLNRFQIRERDDRWGILLDLYKQALPEMDLLSVIPQVISPEMVQKRVFINMLWRKKIT